MRQLEKHRLLKEYLKSIDTPPIGVVNPTGKGKGKGTGTSLERMQGEPFLDRVRLLFHKRTSTPLDQSEAKAWQEARPCVEQTSEEEWQLLEWLYSQRGNDPAKYRRQDMATLFNHWQGSIDRAREWKNGSQKRSLTEYELFRKRKTQQHEQTGTS
jgi:hypothetical protein